MSDVLLERLKGLWVAHPVSHGALTVFALTGGRQGQIEYGLTDEAVKAGHLAVRELPSPTVPELLAVNSSSTPALLLDGEVLVGGWQQRSLNSTVLAPRGQTVLPVSCVEQGRWHNVAAQFSTGESSYPRLRAAQAAQVHSSLQSSGKHVSNQSAVWQSIQQRQQATGVKSATGAMSDIYVGRGDAITAFERALPYPDGAVGAIVAIGGQIVSLEIVDSPRTMRKIWGKLVRASAVDALSSPASSPVDIKRAVRMVHRPKLARFEWYRTPGIGEDVRVVGNGVRGAALIHDGIVVHAALFRQH